MTQEDNLMIEEKFTIIEQGYNIGKAIRRYRMSGIIRHWCK